MRALGGSLSKKLMVERNGIAISDRPRVRGRRTLGTLLHDVMVAIAQLIVSRGSEKYGLLDLAANAFCCSVPLARRALAVCLG